MEKSTPLSIKTRFYFWLIGITGVCASVFFTFFIHEGLTLRISRVLENLADHQVIIFQNRLQTEIRNIKAHESIKIFEKNTGNCESQNDHYSQFQIQAYKIEKIKTNPITIQKIRDNCFTTNLSVEDNNFFTSVIPEKVKSWLLAMEKNPDAIRFEVIQMGSSPHHQHTLALLKRIQRGTLRDQTHVEFIVHLIPMNAIFTIPDGSTAKNMQIGTVFFDRANALQLINTSLSLEKFTLILDKDLPGSQGFTLSNNHRKQNMIGVQPQSNRGFQILNLEVNFETLLIYLINPIIISLAIFLFGLIFTLLFLFLSLRGLKLEIIETKMKLDATENQQRLDFFDSMAHELRTPLNGILGMNNLIFQTKLNTTQTRYVNTIAQSGFQLNLLIDQKLTASRINSGNLKLALVEFRLNDLVIEVLDLLHPLALLKKNALSYQIPFEINGVSFLGDAIRLKQILINLLGNAIKFTENGNISIHLSGNKNKKNFDQYLVSFRIQDDGIGIDEKNREYLFSKFGRIKQETKNQDNFEGGLGLFISQRLLRLMGGNLEFQSALGSGSSFYFQLNLLSKKLASIPVNDVVMVALSEVVIIGNSDDDDVVELIQHLKNKATKILCFSKLSDLKHYFLQCRQDNNFPEWAFVFENSEDFRALTLATFISTWIHRNMQSRLIFLHYTSDYGYRQKMLTAGYLHSHLLPMDYVFLSQYLQGLPPSAPLNIGDASGVSAVEQDTEEKNTKAKNVLSILIADDNIINVEVLRGMLRYLGHQVVSVGNGDAVLNILKNNIFDVVLMDINMPIMNGFETTVHIRKLEDQHQFLPVIAISANSDLAIQEMCRQAGMNGFLAKPIDIITLDNKITEVLEQAPKS